MADSKVDIIDSAGATQSVDTRTEVGNTQHRQVIVVGDPSVNAAVAEVVSADPGAASAAYGQIMRLAGSASIVTAVGTTLRVLLDAATGLPAGVNTLGSIAVFFSPAGPTIRGITDSIAIHVLSTGGTLVTKFAPETGLPAGINTLGSIAVFFNPARPTVIADILSTATVPASTAGTTSAVSASGATIVSPETGRNIKVFAFSLTTTAQVSLATRFTQGSGASPTELWRVALQAPTAPGMAGANLAVTPPGYLFAAGTGNTLSLVLDSASLVHFAVSYFKESA